MIVACIQPQIFQDRKNCYSQVESLFKELFEKYEKCDIVCLPERWVPYFEDSAKSLQKERGKDYTFIKNIAKEFKVNILSGAIWEKRTNSQKPVITCYLFDENGEELGRQEKIHLYSYERELFSPGKELKIFKLNQLCNLAILICFDMAFFETPRLAVENGADLLFSPTQIRDDGMVNWEIYLKARALENRVPIAACNSYGRYLNRKFLGHSKIISFHQGSISPSKLRIMEAPKDSSGFVYDDIDLLFPKEIRKIRLEEQIDKTKISIKIIKN
jgi:predicted amidohydrolase